MRKECRTCKHCKEWEEHRGLYCSNEKGINYTFDVAECDKCDKWEGSNEMWEEAENDAKRT